MIVLYYLFGLLAVLLGVAGFLRGRPQRVLLRTIAWGSTGALLLLALWLAALVLGAEPGSRPG